MDFKMEPDEETLSLDINRHGSFQNVIRSNSIEGHSNGIVDNIQIKQEGSDIGNEQKENSSLAGGTIKKEIDIHLENCKNEVPDASSSKIDDHDVSVCAYAEWIPEQINPYFNASSKLQCLEIEIDCPVKSENILSHANRGQTKNENDFEGICTPQETVAKIMKEKEVFNKRNFVCSVCFEVLKTSNTLKVHENAHKNLQSVKTINVSEKKNPQSKIDHNKLRYKCDLCDYKCAHPHSLKNHIMKHTGEKPYACDQCDFKCRISSHLKTHMNTHSVEKPYNCNICDYKCVRASLLKLHKLSHTGEKPFKCDVCDYRCVLKCYLKVHKMVHTGEKPYKCDLCNFQCRAYSQFKSHKMVHSGEKPFKCSQCDYKTAYSHSLKLHKMKHSGEKPFKCDKCDYKCNYSYRLNKHKSTHNVT